MKKLRVGFDLDGVLLYNPARIIRMPVSRFKKRFFPARQRTFYVPTSPFAKVLWRILHWSSIFAAPGIDEIKSMAKKGLIEPYIITARYDFLEPDFKRWLRRMHSKDFIIQAFHNEKNEQPHIFKERMVKKLKLDVFIEDNWDIVEHLSTKTKTKVFWIFNIFDKNIAHDYKFPSLVKAIAKLHVRKTTKKSRA